MGISLYILLVILSIFLTTKLILIKKSIKEIRINLKKILETDTNNLIYISTLDKDLINLTNDLNVELRILRKQRLQYENGNQELKQDITNISHDLRTPLTGISGYLELLEDEILTEKQISYVKNINDKTNELINLIEQLFVYSKSLDIENKINKNNYCINEILEETIGSYYKAFKEQNIIPTIHICEKEIYKNIDKTMLIRIFNNLISNIIRYSDSDCNIKLQEDGKIIFSNKATSLDATTVKRIFDRYYTIENAKKSTGIGLSIAKKLVELNNGTITGKYQNENLIIEIEFF